MLKYYFDLYLKGKHNFVIHLSRMKIGNAIIPYNYCYCCQHQCEHSLKKNGNKMRRVTDIRNKLSQILSNLY